MSTSVKEAISSTRFSMRYVIQCSSNTRCELVGRFCEWIPLSEGHNLFGPKNQQTTGTKGSVFLDCNSVQFCVDKFYEEQFVSIFRVYNLGSNFFCDAVHNLLN